MALSHCSANDHQIKNITRWERRYTLWNKVRKDGEKREPPERRGKVGGVDKIDTPGLCEDLNEQCDITSVCHRLEASNKKELQKEEKKKREQGNREEKGRMTVCEHLNEKSGIGNER